jgi:membrane protease YdiL (CAAX protease family)
LENALLGLQRLFAFLIAYIMLLLFAYKVDPRFSLKYKKIPSFYYLLFISTLGTVILLLPLVLFNLFLDQDLIAVFGIDHLTFTGHDVLVGLLSAIAIFPLLLSIDALISVFRRKVLPSYKSRREDELEKLVFDSLPKSQKQMFTLLAITSSKAAIFEELIFRGYLLSNLLLFVSPAVAIIIQALFFFIGHLYQGIFNAILPLILGIILGFIFYLTGSLSVIMITHFMVDVIGLVTQAIWIRKKEKT